MMARDGVLTGFTPDVPLPVIHQIGIQDLFAALRRGARDFWEQPSHVAFLCLIYPIVGIVLGWWTFNANALPLLDPLAAGFALLGPIAATGLYEISRRRELGLDTSWRHAFDVVRSPSTPAIVTIGALLLALFAGWLITAQILYTAIFGPEPPASLSALLRQIFTTREGLMLIVAGNALGAAFALVALSISVVSLPLLLDRPVGASYALRTSIAAVRANPGPMIVWGLIVMALLAIGSVPLFVGLALVVPILGHATWHLYRRVVEPPSANERHIIAPGSRSAGPVRTAGLPENAPDRLDARLDEAEDESFPASDPVSILVSR